MKINQYTPNFVSGYERKKAEFKTIKELKEIDFVKKFSEGNDFYQYSIAKDDIQPTLMAEYKKGKKWWVVGFLENNDIDLPEWTPRD